jgi:RNA ligase (TIGR02306 family)
MEEFKRKLTSIQIIDTVVSIKDADKIEQASLRGLGWSFVVKRGEFKTGDRCIYYETDSILPEKEEFEFLRSRKFRIKTIKLKGVVSQGLVTPVPESMKGLEVGTDVTEAMGVRKYDPQAQEEAVDTEDKKHRSVVMKYLMGFKPFRSAYMFLNSKEKGDWPEWFSKTDESRIQLCAKLVLCHFNEEWYVAEKLDGQSFSAFTYDKRVWGFKRRSFGVCSRNIWLKTKHSCNYWNIAEKYDLERKMKAYDFPVVIQGELCGPKIQKNKYNLKELEFFVFNVYINGEMLGVNEMEAFCNVNGLKTVPVLSKSFNPSHIIPVGESGVSDAKTVSDCLVRMAEGNTVLCDSDGNRLNCLREGLVIRLKSDPRVSFKAINPQFLLENDE